MTKFYLVRHGETTYKYDLILFDRGYPSRNFISYLDSSGIRYLMRVKSVSMKEINEAQEPDEIVEMKVDGFIGAYVVRR